MCKTIALATVVASALGLGLIGGFLCAGLPQRSQGAGSMSHPHPSKEPHPKSWVP